MATNSSDTYRFSTKASLVETWTFLEKTKQGISEVHFGEAPVIGVGSELTLIPKCVKDCSRLQTKGLNENCCMLKAEKTHRKSIMSTISK